MFSLGITTVTFLLSLHVCDNTWLSRFKNPTEYVAPPHKLLMPEEVDEDLYSDLLLEIPVLRTYKLRRNKTHKKPRPSLIYLKTILPEPENYDSVSTTRRCESNTSHENADQRLQLMLLDAKNSSNQSQRVERFIYPSYLSGSFVASCFACGLNETKIPSTTICHDAFESQDWKARTLARYFRAKCYHNPSYWAQNIEEHVKDGTPHKTDRGLKRGFYGPYTGGCFKRFMDVGKVYTQRGCRSWWPMYDYNYGFATHRYTRLEALLKHEKDRCIVSPHASLTPFSRSISLFVRYHVCVCSTRYCNSVSAGGLSKNLLLLISFCLLLLNRFVNKCYF